MTNYKQKDVVLVEFGFSEKVGTKRRPALIISSNDYNKSRQEIIVSAITSNIERVLFADTKIGKWEEAGLLYPSLATGIIRTIKANIIERKLGVISEQDFQKVQENIKKALKL